MKVVHVITGLDTGGAEATLYRLCSADRDSAWRHTVISLTGRGAYAARLEAEGVVVHSLEMPRGRVTINGFSRLYSLLRNLRPEVVQTWMYHADLLGGVLAKLTGVKGIVWSIRGPLDPRETSRTTRLVAQSCALLSYYVPKRIVSCSVYAADVHQTLGYNPGKFTVIPNGYPLDRLAPMPDKRLALREAFNASDDLPLLGMVARFDPYKDHSTLVGALGILKRRNVRFRCLLVGSGLTEDNAFLGAMIQRADVEDEIGFLGARDDIPEVMNALDIHVLSSLGEAFPNVLAEAMACGTPCVTTDVGDSRLIIGDTGWSAPPKDPAGLADAIQVAIRAMDDRTSWQARQRACRLRIEEKFGVDRMREAYRRVWIESATNHDWRN
jgi:glycosyltransferase involved in cell wall biosynthesis